MTHPFNIPLEPATPEQQAHARAAAGAHSGKPRFFTYGGQPAEPNNPDKFDYRKKHQDPGFLHPVRFVRPDGAYVTEHVDATDIQEVPMGLAVEAKRVYVASPLSAPTPEGIAANIQAAGRYCLHVLEQGHVPYAPHAFLVNFLNDGNPGHRAIALQVGLYEIRKSDELWFWGYPSAGMKAEIQLALSLKKPVKMFEAGTSTYLGDLLEMSSDGSLKVSREVVVSAPY